MTRKTPETHTPTRECGYGFLRVGVRVALGYPRVTRDNPYDEAMPLGVSPDTRLLVHSLSMGGDQQLEAAREELRRYADPLCKEVHETDLPPFRAINP